MECDPPQQSSGSGGAVAVNQIPAALVPPSLAANPTPGTTTTAASATNGGSAAPETTTTATTAAATTTAVPPPAAPVTVVTVSTAAAAVCDAAQSSTTSKVVTIPVPIVPQEENYVYVMVKGSLHDRSVQVFGLNQEETQAVARRFENNVKPVVNGIMVGVTPPTMINTLAQLSYKVVCATGEVEICWTMQREV